MRRTVTAVASAVAITGLLALLTLALAPQFDGRDELLQAATFGLWGG